MEGGRGQRGNRTVCCVSEDSVVLLGLWTIGLLALVTSPPWDSKIWPLLCPAVLIRYNYHRAFTIWFLYAISVMFYLYFQSPVSTLLVDLHPKYEWTWMPSSWSHHWSHRVAAFQEYRCESLWEKSGRFAGPHGEWKISWVLLVHVPSKGRHCYCPCILLYSVWPQGVDHLWYACKRTLVKCEYCWHNPVLGEVL